jgi:hypothetical protein
VSNSSRREKILSGNFSEDFEEIFTPVMERIVSNVDFPEVLYHKFIGLLS